MKKVMGYQITGNPRKLCSHCWVRSHEKAEWEFIWDEEGEPPEVYYCDSCVAPIPYNQKEPFDHEGN